MSFLDAKAAREDDPQMVALHEILIRAYADRVDALSIAGSVGILQADIEVYYKMRHTWWSILNEAAKESQHGVLRRLVANVLKDPTRAAIRDDILAIIDVPEDQLWPSARPLSNVKPFSAKIGIGERAPLWAPGSTIKIRFIDGESTLHDRVEKVALEWLDYANLKFDFGDYPDADVRIAFGKDGISSWSFAGTSCLDVQKSEPTMNLGWLGPKDDEAEFRRIVLHEFGHVLGMQHEHGNPNSTIKWNKKAVYDDLSAPPNNWPRELIEYSIFSIWPPGYYPFQKIFDLKSIEMYTMDDKWFADGQAPGSNYELSQLDKQFIAALYPRRER
ncbi:MAG TPA: hypothetical protein PLI05_11925 [Methanotrichaceae archaeon]|nr:MAG: hypothetical protein A4E49_00078 [Methanosaeta sp. PtaU1.Bin112]HQF17756.1 hypothetical protein [Methanotrichaceae archaeon]HQI92379.1 hypothetical protein [Methanotrichaceae archaeon]